MGLDAAQHTVTIAAGAYEEIFSPGVQAICYESTGQAEISTDNGKGWVPFMRGVEVNEPHQKLILRNTTGLPITVTLVQTAKFGAYKDRRELAAQIAVDGGIVTNTSPSIDHGGSVHQMGESYNIVTIDQTGLGAATVLLIDGTLNVNGVRVRKINLMLWTITSGSTREISVTPSDRRWIYEWWDVADDNTDRSYDLTFDVPPGESLKISVRADDVITAIIFFDYL